MLPLLAERRSERDAEHGNRDDGADHAAETKRRALEEPISRKPLAGGGLGHGGFGGGWGRGFELGCLAPLRLDVLGLAAVVAPPIGAITVGFTTRPTSSVATPAAKPIG